jgi:hypothetical protein
LTSVAKSASSVYGTGAVGLEAVRGELEAARRGPREIVHELLSIGPRPLAKVPSNDQLRVPLNRREAVGVTMRFVVPQLLPDPFVATDEPPHFIGLNVRNGNPVDRGFQEPLTLLPRRHHRVNDRVPVNPGQPFDGADGVAF